MSTVIVISGIPAAGKSTIARLLANSFPRSVLISGDDLRALVVGGFRDPNNPWDEEMRSQYYLSFQNEAALARTFLNKNFDVVIDDVIRKGDLYEEWLRHFAGIDHKVVLLRPSVEVALRRNFERAEKTVPDS